jgi:hypothetical protein
MATREVYFSNVGAPTAGLTLTWESLLKVSDGTNFTPQPTFEEIGGGWYKFDVDPTEKLVGVIDGGASLSAQERYQPVYFDVYDFLYEMYCQPVYDEDTDTITFIAFMLKNGKKVSAPTSCSISVYDASHVLQFTVSSSSATNGVFVLTKSTPNLIKNTAYYAVVSIIEDGVTHESVDTYISLE